MDFDARCGHNHGTQFRLRKNVLEGNKVDKHELKDNKVVRSNNNLLESLRKHVNLLRQYHEKAFTEGDTDYLGEVAGKFRLLVYDRGCNKALLKDMMRKFNINVRLEMIGPGFPNGATIGEYFNHVCGAFRSTDEEKLIKVTPMGVVVAWAQQMGSSHEDPSLDREFAQLISLGLLLMESRLQLMN